MKVCHGMKLTVESNIKTQCSTSKVYIHSYSFSVFNSIIL